MKEFSLQLEFEDQTIEIRGRDDETVLDAARRQGYPLLADCTLGLCGTCKGQRVQGTLETDDLGEEGLTPLEKRRGFVLTCQAMPRSDAHLKFGYPSTRLRAAGPRRFTGTLRELEFVADSVARLVIELPDASKVAFEAGQYVNIRVPGSSGMRSFSFANPPFEPRALEFFVRVLPDGLMSNYVRDRARLGDSIELEGAFGEFSLKPAARPILMVAGGTGLAPMLSMLDVLRDTGDAKHGVRLLYGANRMAELFGLARLEEYVRSIVGFEFEVTVLEANPQWKSNVGLVTGLLQPRFVDSGDVDAYLCGPPRMIDAVTEWLLRHGLADERIHTEKFLPSG